ILMAAVSFWLICRGGPHGGWDAWAIWNLRARFLYRAGDDWGLAFSDRLAWSHPDYPLLLPANVVRGWLWAGSETLAVPQLLAGLFTLGTTGVLIAALTLLRSATVGLLAGAVLLSSPLFLEVGAAQYADVPFALSLTAAAALLALHDRHPLTSLRLVVVAGVFAGLSAWTKNEGWLSIVALATVRVLVAVGRGSWRAMGRDLGAFFLGLGPVLLVLVQFKWMLAPANDLLAAGVKHWHERLLDAGRYAAIAGQLVHDLARVNPELFLVLAVYALLLGIASGPGSSPERSGLVLLLVLMLAGYGGVYLFLSAADLAWHLQSSLYRLVVQLLPLALLTFFDIVATPEEARRAGPSADVPA
ncbi:MAG: hypothetical protein NZ700_02530, partial [Gemmataceae bacterium]|nr:hypothetical protein [Gemmataceae bacterium]MDW8264304.1 hypothetical protein [Gemmataceae bacterium]